MKVTRWSPDTCGCVVEYEWDDTVPAKNRVRKFKACVRKCPRHAHLDDEAVYNAITEENSRKNIALQMASRRR